LLAENGQDVAKARQNLQTIAEADQAVVTRVGSQVKQIHVKHARRRHAGPDAAACLQTQAALWAVFLTARASLEAAALDVVLTALIVLHLSIQNTISDDKLTEISKPKYNIHYVYTYHIHTREGTPAYLVQQAEQGAQKKEQQHTGWFLQSPSIIVIWNWLGRWPFGSSSTGLSEKQSRQQTILIPCSQVQRVESVLEFAVQ
jgi:hypothetical protein